MRDETVFTRPDAVEAWDALFRWRDGTKLHDTTVEDTWRRVARAVALAEGAGAESWAETYATAFRKWRLLPDERLLRAAGTGRPIALREPSMAVNAAAFVDASAFPAPRLLRAQLADCAALAVRFLDDALLASSSADGPDAVRIGLIGTTNALESLGAARESSAASQLAREIGRALYEGCLRASVDLALERGARAHAGPPLLRRWREAGVPEPLIVSAGRHGLRYRNLTALLPHPSLARLANGVRDGLDWGEDDARGAGRGQLRAAMQPYFDLPIAD
jgi:ribonucleoside-diphosphate reductase alpha chain